jgi:hypothetical protein
MDILIEGNVKRGQVAVVKDNVRDFETCASSTTSDHRLPKVADKDIQKSSDWKDF